MTNPAYELARILETWTVGPNGPRDARERAADAANTTFNDQAVEAMRALADLMVALDELDARGLPTESLRHGLSDWVSAITSESVPWGQGTRGPVEALGEAQLQNLKAVGMVLDAHGAALLPRPAMLDTVLSAIAEARQVLISADLTESMRHYLLSILARIEEALVAGRTGAYFAAVNEFVGATTVAAATETDPDRRRWWETLRNEFMSPAIANAVGSGLYVGAAALLTQITGS